MAGVYRFDRGRNCGTCDFWQRIDDERADFPWRGECHFRPPVTTEPKFPIVTTADWCGEYVASPEATR